MKRDVRKLIEQKLSGVSASEIIEGIEKDHPPIPQIAKDLDRDLKASGVSGHVLEWDGSQTFICCEADRDYLTSTYRVLDAYQEIYPEIDFAASWRD